jgi:hypothetical protein
MNVFDNVEWRLHSNRGRVWWVMSGGSGLTRNKLRVRSLPHLYAKPVTYYITCKLVMRVTVGWGRGVCFLISLHCSHNGIFKLSALEPMNIKNKKFNDWYYKTLFFDSQGYGWHRPYHDMTISESKPNWNCQTTLDQRVQQLLIC